MYIIRPKAVAVATAAVLILLGLLAPGAAAQSQSPRSAAGPRIVPSTTPPFPAMNAAGAAAGWLAQQLSPAGFLPSATTPGTADLSGTVNTVLALTSTGSGRAQVQAALAYLGAHVDATVTSSGSDGAGQLATLILAVHAAGADPRSFGGKDLVARLLATRQPSGLFGAQDPTFDGAFRQGLALAALAAAGETPTTDGANLGPATTWLHEQQCSDGGWTSYRADSSVPCPPADPNTFTGPDTNSTALAVQGLAAQHVSPAHDAVAWFSSIQESDGGFAFIGASGQASDGDSTAEVIQALIASGVAPASDARVVKAGHSPVSALLGLQVGCVGALAFQPNPDGTLTPNSIATEQAVPALAGVAFPFGPTTLNSVVPGAPCPYWAVGGDGGVFAFGARYEGSLGGRRLNAPIVGMATTPDGAGYWLAGADGGVYAFGSARFLGSAGSIRLARPIVGMAATPDGAGYWLVASDGGVFAFGDAAFFGSTGHTTLNQPIVGMAASPDAAGYWLVAADGGIFAFGSASYHGSMGAVPLNQPVVGMAAASDGAGYWLVGRDGGVFAFGSARFFGSTGSVRLNQPVVGMALTVDGRGYWLVARDGGIFAFGTAGFFGSAGSLALQSPVVGMAASPIPAAG